MFNPDPLKPSPRHWLDDTWLNSSTRPIQGFGEFDWNSVPKLDYALVKFRQLATPEAAKVLDEDTGFKLETFGKPAGFKLLNCQLKYQARKHRLFKKNKPNRNP